ncbi:MAG: TlyA family RNA methyltransferase [Ruminococcaceae bacterium]|nr:TlyA family RNA methyltransferase [Oscillospiraceae bacterium]
MRLDVYLVESGIAKTRQRGRYLIDNGCVKIDGAVCTKASFDVDGHKVEICGEGIPYVSRGGFKLEGALREFEVSVSGCVCADIGSSTGGFTDCLLKNGAGSVFAIDSGSDQLHESLRNDSRVTVMENFNAKGLTREVLKTEVDIAVCDLSFISQRLIHRNVADILKSGGSFISLIKPQFEAGGREFLGKGGIVKDSKVQKRAIDDVVKSADENGMDCIKVIVSPIKGKDGNTEYLAWFKKR